MKISSQKSYSSLNTDKAKWMVTPSPQKLAQEDTERDVPTSDGSSRALVTGIGTLNVEAENSDDQTVPTESQTMVDQLQIEKISLNTHIQGSTKYRPNTSILHNLTTIKNFGNIDNQHKRPILRYTELYQIRPTLTQKENVDPNRRCTANSNLN